MAPIPRAKPITAFTHPSGVAGILGRYARVALGNPYHHASYWSETPWRKEIWSARHLEASIDEVDGMPGSPIRSRVLDMLREDWKEGRWQKMNVFPFPWAQRDIRRRRSFKGLAGGRNSTKSTAVADYLLTEGCNRKIRYACARQFYSNIKDSVQETLGDRIEALNLQDRYEIKGTEVVGRNGTHFIFVGLDRNFEGVKSIPNLDGFWMEEAHSIPKKAFNVSIATLREKGFQAYFSWNPTREDDPVHEFFYGDKDNPSKLLIESSYLDNPFLTYDSYLYIESRKKTNYAEYEHEYGGKLEKHSEAMIYPHWEIGDLDDMVLESRVAPIFGLDIGSSAPTAFIEAYPLEVDGAKVLYVAEEKYETKITNDGLPSFLVGPDFEDHPRWDPYPDHDGIPYAFHYPIIIDEANVRERDLLNARGFKVILCSKTGKFSVLQGIRDLKNWKIVINPECRNTLYEIARYKWKVDKHTGKIVPDVPEKSEDHAMDALRYAVQAFDRGLYNAERLH